MATLSRHVVGIDGTAVIPLTDAEEAAVRAEWAAADASGGRRSRTSAADAGGKGRCRGGDDGLDGRRAPRRPRPAGHGQAVKLTGPAVRPARRGPNPDDLLQNVRNMIGWLRGRGLSGTVIVGGGDLETITATGARSDVELSEAVHALLDFVAAEGEQRRDVRLSAAAKEAYAAFNKHYPAIRIPQPIASIAAGMS
jgi:hypothetical protein